MSDAPAYPRLFEPLDIGPVRSRNRIIFGPHFTMMGEPNPTWGEPGFFGARHGEYAADRAHGGAGVVTVGHVHVHPSTAYSMRNNGMAWVEEAIPHFRDVTGPIHGGGALAFIQLSHSGAKSAADWSVHPLLSPSGVPVNAEAPKTLERHEIDEIVEHFARSALNAVDGGFDGIEIHGAHHYLVHEFLSPVTNHRTDEYGGSFENRLRFAIEVLTAVRARVGPLVAVGIRLAGDDLAADGSGITPAVAGEIAAALEELGLVDFVNVSVGNLGGLVQPMYHPHLLGVYAAAEVKQAVRSTPVFAVHRIITPDEAEGVLERGEADAVTLVRALIADPDWPTKARQGRADEIRRCVGCNQLCYGNLYRSLPIQCVTNPAVGRDAELGSGTLRPATTTRRVVVVGGGPGGLEAALVAAARGHDVTMLERDEELGGKIRLARQLPGRAEVGDWADWRIGECQRRGVDIRLGVDADVDTVLGLVPDTVIVATGGVATTHPAAPGQVAAEGLGASLLVDHETALANPDVLGARVLVVDVVGHVEGVGLAELLAELGREVTLAVPFATLVQLDTATAGGALRRAGGAGVTWRPSTQLTAVEPGKAVLTDLLSRATSVVPADTVVVRGHGRPLDGLYHSLVTAGATVRRIGDAVAVRPADRAIFEGHLAGREI